MHVATTQTAMVSAARCNTSGKQLHRFRQTLRQWQTNCPACDKQTILTNEHSCIWQEQSAYLMDVLDVDASSCCIVFQDDLLKEHECALMLCMLPDLQYQDKCI